MPALETQIKELAGKLKAAQREQFEVLEAQIAEAKAAGKGTAELKEQVVKANGEVAALTDKLKSLADEQAAEKQKMNERLDEFERLYVDPQGKLKSQSPGEQLIESEIYKRASKAEQDRFAKVAVEGIMAARYKDQSGLSDAAGGVLQDSLRLQGVIVQPNVTLIMRDLIPQTNMQNRTVDYVRETGFTNNAAPVAESSAASPTTKPQSSIAFDLVTETMRTIAHWVPASKQILRYANRTQLRNYIDGRLRYGLDHELEDQLLLGDGTGQNLNGVVPQATAYNQGFAQIQGAAPTHIDTLRRAITQARIAEYPVTGMVLHPADWEVITLTKDADLRYIYGHPGQMGIPRIWGVPIAQSTRMTELEFLIGAFSMGAEIFFGMQATVEASEHHEEYFTKNLVAIRAELDALIAVYRPEAFITGTFTAS